MSQAPIEHHELLRDQISQTITELGILLGLVEDLVDAPQRGLLGFLSPDARQLLDELTRQEITARRAHIHDGIGPDVGLRFMNADYPVRGTASPTPMNLSPASFEAHAWATLQHRVKLVGYHLQRRDPIADADRDAAETDRGWCTWPRPARPVRDLAVTVQVDGTTTVPTTRDLAAHLRILCWEIRRYQLLEETLRDLEHLITLGETVVDGADRQHLGECPHCGRDTLVVHWRTDETTGTRVPHFARCEKDPKTGHHEPCTCESAWCACKETPVSYRHTWWHNQRDAPDPRIAHNWHDLASRLNIRRATKEPTP